MAESLSSGDLTGHTYKYLHSQRVREATLCHGSASLLVPSTTDSGGVPPPLFTPDRLLLPVTPLCAWEPPKGFRVPWGFLRP